MTGGDAVRESLLSWADFAAAGEHLSIYIPRRNEKLMHNSCTRTYERAINMLALLISGSAALGSRLQPT